MKAKNMSNPETEMTDELRSEYVLSQLTGKTRGRYVQRHREEARWVMLDSDVAESFPDTESVNEALRMLIAVAQKQVHTRR